MSRAAKNMYDFPPSLSDELLIVELQDSDENKIQVAINLEFGSDEDGNKTVVAYEFLTQFDKEVFTEWKMEISDAIQAEGYKVWDDL